MRHEAVSANGSHGSDALGMGIRTTERTHNRRVAVQCSAEGGGNLAAGGVVRVPVAGCAAEGVALVAGNALQTAASWHRLALVACDVMEAQAARVAIASYWDRY